MSHGLLPALLAAERRAAAAERRLAEVTAERDELVRKLNQDELRRKLAAAHAELMRRHRRDQDLARHLPAMAARLNAIAADCTEPESAPMPLEDVVDQDGW